MTYQDGGGNRYPFAKEVVFRLKDSHLTGTPVGTTSPRGGTKIPKGNLSLPGGGG